MLDVHTAVQKAIQFANQLLNNPPLVDVRLEEVEKWGSEEWLVTLSYIRPGTQTAALTAAIGPEGLKREWRIVQINKEWQSHIDENSSNMMQALDTLLARHRRVGVVIDTNLLLLLFVGNFERNEITTFSRLSDFTVDDYDLLKRLLNGFVTIITTPTILAETVAFCGHFRGAKKGDFYRSFAESVTIYEESYTASKEIAADEHWFPLGITDCSIIRLASASHLVLTTDAKLWATLEKKGLDAINFNHYRPTYMNAING